MLTLTHGEAAQLVYVFDNRPIVYLLTYTFLSADSPTTSLSELESSSDLETESTTPKVSESSEGHGTPQGSGTTTPTETSTITDASKSARAFLGLSTLTDFIRLRYPSRSGDPDETDGSEATQNGGDAGHEGGVAVSESGTGEAREIREDKLSLALTGRTALVPSIQGE